MKLRKKVQNDTKIFIEYFNNKSLKDKILSIPEVKKPKKILKKYLSRSRVDNNTNDT